MPFRRGGTVFLALTPTSVIDYVFRDPIVLSWGNPSRSSYLSVVAELNCSKSDTIPTSWGRFFSTFSLLQIDMQAYSCWVFLKCLTCTVPKHWVLDGFIVRPWSTRSFLPAQNWLRSFLQWLDLLSASYSQLTLLEVWELVGSCLIGLPSLLSNDCPRGMRTAPNLSSAPELEVAGATWFISRAKGPRRVEWLRHIDNPTQS